MCKEALTKVKKKYHAWKRYTATKHYKDYEAYIKLRNEATKGVRSAKRQFERRLAKEIKENPKGFWNYVRSKTKVKSGISDLVKENGDKTSSDVYLYVRNDMCPYASSLLMQYYSNSLR